MEENTLNALIESISNSDNIKKIIINNIINKEDKVVRLNLVYISYDFSSRYALIEYYVEDDEYPVVNISFDRLTGLIKNLK